MPNHIFPKAEVIWSDFLSAEEKNTLLGVGLRFRGIIYKNRQYFRDIISVHPARIIHELVLRGCETGNPLAGLSGAQRARRGWTYHRATAGA